ncbi:efflux RND transporter periplasmic adaptor subunit [uncultured Anaerotruncus sp.]|uniref:efflux RND transporter periplasmic adaptor subunit n=1 Tax=uncultured Anaerotruncus sp. TaxID=905011 RepID=UPI00280B4E91|nr:efflux RND transporter periplasmic adaptor subunit [uncultured Anaerotruncus sp.]
MKKFLSKKNIASAVLVVALAAAAVSTVVLAAGGGPGGGGPGGMGGNLGEIEMSESVISVKLTSPAVGSLTRSTEFIGKIKPGESVNVYPEVAGKVTAVYFTAGDTVKAGDLLFEMDDSDAQLSYEIAQTSYDSKVISADTTLGSSYESNLLSLESSLKSAQQSLNNARIELRDYNDDSEDSLISAQKAMDKAETAMRAAEAELDAYAEANPGDKSSETYKDLVSAVSKAESSYSVARATVNDLENDDDSTLRSLRNSYKNAQTNYESALEKYNLAKGASLEDTRASVDNSLKSAQLSLEQSAKQLEKYKVYSPIDGVIEASAVTEHETASLQTAAFTISNKNQMSVTFNATADAATALSIGDGVTVQKSGNDYAAIITSIDSKADDSTGLFPIEAQIQDDGGALLSGVTVKVSAATQRAENALLVPIDSVYYEDGQAYVFTYANGEAHRTDFETGMSNSETVVALSGLDEGSRIITTWHPDLKDGAKVELAEGQADPGAGAASADSPADSAGESAPDAPEQEDAAGTAAQED